MALSIRSAMMDAPGLPYTRKMRAVLRYRRIPYRMILNFSEGHASHPQPKVALLPTFYLADENGREVPVTDSTPLIRRWVSKPFPYQGKCLRWLREEYAALSAGDRADADAIFAGSGCEALLA